MLYSEKAGNDPHVRAIAKIFCSVPRLFTFRLKKYRMLKNVHASIWNYMFYTSKKICNNICISISLVVNYLGRLRKYAKKSKEEFHQYPWKVDYELFAFFSKYCESLNLSVNEGLTLLVSDEIESYKEQLPEAEQEHILEEFRQRKGMFCHGHPPVPHPPPPFGPADDPQAREPFPVVPPRRPRGRRPT